MPDPLINFGKIFFLMTKKALFLLFSFLAGQTAWALDEVAAEALARKSGCLKCHALDKKKDGPTLKEMAAKYKGKADAESKLITHITSSPKVKIDGKEEDHEAIKSKDAGDIKNVAQWILTR